MLSNMVPDWEPMSQTDATPMAWALARMVTGVGVPRLPEEELFDLWAPALDGETFLDALTRKAAAADILDELLTEYATEHGEGADRWTS